MTCCMGKLFSRLCGLAAMVMLGVSGAKAATVSPPPGAVFGDGARAQVVVLHGDVSRGGEADYRNAVTRDIAAGNPGVTAVALLGPGYYDGEGRKSPGSAHGRKDQFTAATNLTATDTIRSLKAASALGKTIAVGHSDGVAGKTEATRSADIPAASPAGLVEALLKAMRL